MKFLRADSAHNISALQKSGTVGEYNLKWKSVGLQMFIVVFGRNVDDVSIDVKNTNNSKLCSLLMDENQNITNREILNDDISVCPITFTQFRQRGGYSVKGNPGVYAVYGCEIKDDDIIIYVSDNAVCRLSVDLNVEDIPVMNQKGFIRKVEYYAGYHKITVQKGVSGLKGNSVYYMIDSKPYKYPFPDIVIQEGGCFYVQCSEMSKIAFFTTNREGIRIRS